jgi:hypothetical protein
MKMIKRGTLVYCWIIKGMFPKKQENRRWIAQFIYHWTMKGMFSKEHENCR